MQAGGGRKRRTTKRRKSSSTSPGWGFAAWIVGAFVVVVVVSWVLLRHVPTGPDQIEGELDRVIRSIAAEHGAVGVDLETDIEIRKVNGVFVRSWRLDFPDLASREEFIAQVRVFGDRDDVSVRNPIDQVGQVIGLRIDHGVEAFDLRLSVKKRRETSARPAATRVPRKEPVPTARPEPSRGARGKLAILLDDGGQSMELVSRAAALPPQVGVAILPFLPNSVETAAEMHDAGHEVWLHLPMEAVGEEHPGPGALLVDMSDDELRNTVHIAINNMPHVVGINNHMGSRATANLRVMTWVMQELSAMDLAFIDSRTTVDTVAEDAARAQGVPAGRRHIFLDNERSAAAVRRQLDEAVYRARMEGEIIAIGHLTEITVKVLAKELPGLEKRGADLVAPTTLLR